MASTADHLIDRRRLRRKLTFWRVAAILVVAVAVLMAGVYAGIGGVGGVAGASGSQIARVSVEGLITEDRSLLDLLEELKDEDRVEAVIVAIDSPGGTTVGGESIYNAVREIGTEKPVVAEVGTMAASAGYMIAAGTDAIVAHRTSIVGSIGVIFQYANLTDLMSRIGVDVRAIKSTPLKAEPSPFSQTPPEAEAMIERLIMDTYDWFVTLVAERRDLSDTLTRRIADGSVFTGHQGLERQLVDRLGGRDEVIAYLEEEREVSPDLPIVDREPEEPGFGLDLFAHARAAAFETLGLDPGASTLPDAVARKAGRLDGLVSLWQPEM